MLYVAFSDDFLNTIDKSRSMDVFITEELERYAQSQDTTPLGECAVKFPRIFALLKEILGENAFKKYQNDAFKGPVMLAAFESIIPGLYLNLDYWELHKTELVERIKQIYSQEAYISATRRGTRALDRMSQLIKFSRVWFDHEN